MKHDPDAHIASAKRVLWVRRGPLDMRISTEDRQMTIFQRPDAKEWSRIVNLALGSKARVVSIIDDGRDGL